MSNINAFLANRFTFDDAGDQYFNLDLDRFSPDGYFSVQAKVDSGAGLVDIGVEVSLNGSDFHAIDGSPVLEDVALATGPEMDSFSPIPARFIRIKVSADAACVVDVWVFVS